MDISTGCMVKTDILEAQISVLNTPLTFEGTTIPLHSCLQDLLTSCYISATNWKLTETRLKLHAKGNYLVFG